MPGLIALHVLPPVFTLEDISTLQSAFVFLLRLYLYWLILDSVSFVFWMSAYRSVSGFETLNVGHNFSQVIEKAMHALESYRFITTSLRDFIERTKL